MNEWTVVSVLAALVGLFITIGKPIINLNNSITLLNANVKRNTEELTEQKKELQIQRQAAKDSHSKLWEKNAEQDNVLQDHEIRIRGLEDKQ